MTEQTIFIAALEIADPAERVAYLGKACDGDAALRQQLEALLAAHERPGAFLDVPACEQMAACPPPPDHGTLALEANAEGAAIVAEQNDGYDPDQTEGEPFGDDQGNLQHFVVPHPARRARPPGALRSAGGARPGRLRHRAQGVR